MGVHWRLCWVNRSLPDAELGEFVRVFAYRMTSFPASAVEAVKQRVNAITLPSVDAVRSDAAIFIELAKSKEVKNRLASLDARGFGMRDGDVELNFGRVLGELGL